MHVDPEDLPVEQDMEVEDSDIDDSDSMQAIGYMYSLGM